MVLAAIPVVAEQLLLQPLVVAAVVQQVAILAAAADAVPTVAAADAAQEFVPADVAFLTAADTDADEVAAASLRISHCD